MHDTTAPDPTKLADAIQQFWMEQALPQFETFVTIPCISPSYDPDWQGPPNYLEQACQLAQTWIGSLESLQASFQSGPDGGSEPPVLLVHIPGTGPGSVLTYGHFDKQTVDKDAWHPPAGFTGKDWGPFVPNVFEGLLYGRGTSDDGFATFTVITALAAMDACGMPRPTVNVIVDFDEESGSLNLEDALNLDSFRTAIGQPDLCIELDSSIGTYETFWYGGSARGTITGTLTVQTLTEAVHSGDGGGIIPNPINILRLLLDRIEDAATGRVIIPQFQVPIPAAFLAAAQAQAAGLGSHLVGDFPWYGNAYPYQQDPVQIVLDKTWRAALAVTGQDGLPSTDNASNVIIPKLSCQLSVRLPPTVDVDEAQKVLQQVLQADPPFGATVTYDYEGAPIGAGWVTPARAPWFEQALQQVSQAVWKKDPVPSGDGGTISVLNLMTELYANGEDGKNAQILATGAAGPGNNEHGPNENLNLQYALQLTQALALTMRAASMNASEG